MPCPYEPAHGPECPFQAFETEEEQCDVCGENCRRFCKGACRRCYMEVRNFVKDHVIRSTYHVLFLCQTCGNSDIFQWRARAEEELPRHFGSGYDVKRTVFYIYYEAEAEIMYEQRKIRNFEGSRFRCVRCDSPHPNQQAQN